MLQEASLGNMGGEGESREGGHFVISIQNTFVCSKKHELQ